MHGHIAVVGSLNRDTVVQVDRLPVPGETVIGSAVSQHRGGKGANQAIAAARLGREVALIGKVGADSDGTGYLRALVQEGVDVEGVLVDIDTPTGQAFIMVDREGENSIAVVPGANGRLRTEDVARATTLEGARIVLAQLEVPLDAVKAAARLCTGTFILNPAPAQQLGPELLALVDVLVVNRSELALLAGSSEARTARDVIAQAKGLALGGAVVVTLGAQGAVTVNDGAVREIGSPLVTAVDTTGAGDAFCGGLADGLARNETLEDAVRWAVIVGAVATTKVGAQTALPTSARVQSVVGSV